MTTVSPNAPSPILGIPQLAGALPPPRLIFTVCPEGDRPPAQLVEELKKRLDGGDPGVPTPQARIFQNAEDAQAFIAGQGIPPEALVAIFQERGARGAFRMRTRLRADDHQAFPAWSQGALWGVGVYTPYASRIPSCANQIFADFCKRFDMRLVAGDFPWGTRRKNESPPAKVQLPPKTPKLLAALNQGPDLARSIANADFAKGLPAASRISWYRIPLQAVTVDEAKLQGCVDALQAFERACAALLKASPDIRADILAGVELSGDPLAAELYLDPGVDSFTVDRPDLHFTGDGFFASEVDEMPGGMPELRHIDESYGVNETRWKYFFDALHAEGPLVFLVSDGWSNPYIEETRWLVGDLRRRGYSAVLLTTDRAEDLRVATDGIFLGEHRIGTIWRQFPIFEARGHLLRLVEAARLGRVRMVPEFAHFGNKAWFALYRGHRDFYAARIPGHVALLDSLLPDTHLVRSPEDFPCRVGGTEIASLAALAALPKAARAGIVLKVCGANPLAARSYGVRIGATLTDADWAEWIRDIVASGKPFLVQARIDTAVERLPVMNTQRGEAEFFASRWLLRPWSYQGRLISVAGCNVPPDTTKVHGRVDMAVVPYDLSTWIL